MTTATTLHHEHQGLLEVVWDLEGPAPMPVAVTLRALPGEVVTPAAWRAVPLGAALSAGRRRLGSRLARATPTAAAPVEGPRGRGRPRRYAPEHYRAVLAAFDELRAAGDRAPVRSLAERYGVPKETAQSWVARARMMRASERNAS